MTPLLLFCADIHLSELPPTIRSNEPDWFAAQARQLEWLRTLQNQYQCPIVAAGDIFDLAIGSARIINFAIDNLPIMYTIPGNHDLPYHNIDKVNDSSYGTLVRAGNLLGLISEPTELHIGKRTLAITGFPFNAPPPRSIPTQASNRINIAVIHQYLWTDDYGHYPGVPAAYSLTETLKRYPGYDYYVFGDNHIGFLQNNVLNCGTFFQRTRDDVKHPLHVGLLYVEKDILGIKTIAIPTEHDIITISDIQKTKALTYDFQELCRALQTSETLMCDVSDLLKQYILKHNVSTDVQDALYEITQNIQLK